MTKRKTTKYDKIVNKLKNKPKEIIFLHSCCFDIEWRNWSCLCWKMHGRRYNGNKFYRKVREKLEEEIEWEDDNF